MTSASPPGPRRRRPVGLLTALPTVVVLAGCSASAPGEGASGAAPPASPSAAPGAPSAGESPSGVRILQPGAPGEPNRSVDPARVPTPDRRWNHADVAFMQMMIPHHAQALEMSRLARERAGSDAVRILADRIEGAQGPEIRFMATWLDDRGLEVPPADGDPMAFDHGAHGHDGMQGMMTPAQMAALSAARGAAFDRLFLEGMIRHHRGAIDMAKAWQLAGSDMTVQEIAGDVSATQTAEIARMQDLLADL